MSKLWPVRSRIAVCLVIATVAVFAQALGFGFFQIDDSPLLLDNPAMHRGLSPQTLLWSLSSMHLGNWMPVTWLSHALDFALYGSAASGHHLSSVVVHLLNSLLLFALLDRLTGHAMRSGCVAALFALHPLHVESVVWIAYRKDLLAAFFGLAACWVYVGFARRGGRARYLAVCALFALGLMAKSVLVSLPFALLLLDAWPLNRLGDSARTAARRVVEKLPLFALAAAVASLTWVAQQTAGAVVPTAVLPLEVRIDNAIVSYASYIEKALWPARLAVFYPHPYLYGTGGLGEARVAGALALLASLTFLAWMARRAGYPLVGWLWYLGMLVPTIGLVQVGPQAMANRYSYLPLIGLFLFGVWGVADLARRGTEIWPRVRPLSLVAACVLLLACGAASWREVGYWRDSVTLLERGWETTRHWNLHFQVGRALRLEERTEEAIVRFRWALEAAPRDGPPPLRNALGSTHYELAQVLELSGQHPGALDHYRRALELLPRSAEIRRALAAALASGSEE